MTTATLHFRIEGQYVTDLARNLVEEGRWQLGLKMLATDISGSSYDIAVEVLRGEKRFVGVNNMELLDETEERRAAWQARVDYQFAGICSQHNRLWKPYAYVTHYTREDMLAAAMTKNRYNAYNSRGVPTKGAAMRQWSAARATYYMDDQLDDIAIPSEDAEQYGVATLWQLVQYPPPFWIEPTRDWQVALREFMAVHETGLEPRSVVSKPKKTPEDERKDLEARNRDIDTWHAQERVRIGEFLRQNPHDLDTGNGWLDLKGRLVPCQYHEHLYYAQILVEQRYPEAASRGRPDDVLRGRGYVKLQRFDWVSLYSDGERVTQAQFDTLVEYAAKHNMAVPEGLEIV